MDAQEKYHYWLEHAKYDLDSADAMYKTGRWLYVAFMCQQALEKLIKGLYGLYLDFEQIPRTHNMRRLVTDFANELPHDISEELYALFDLLSQHYLNHRYPDYIGDLLHQTTAESATALLEQTKEAFTWLQTLKP